MARGHTSLAQFTPLAASLFLEHGAFGLETLYLECSFPVFLYDWVSPFPVNVLRKHALEGADLHEDLASFICIHSFI